MIKSSMVTTLFIGLVMSIFQPIIVQAQDNSCVFQRINIEDGLSQSDVKSIIQDSLGYMWFGTMDGLNMYDGEKFVVYKFNGEKGKSLGGSQINSIVEDMDGNIWAATNNGVSKIGTDREKVINYVYVPMDEGTISSNKCNFIKIDSKGRIWVGTERGISLYDELSDTFQRYTTVNNKEINVTSIEEDDRGVIWIGTKEGLFYIPSGKNKVEKFNGIDDIEITSLCYSKRSELWIGVREKGLRKLNLSSKRSIAIDTESKTYKDLPSNNIFNILEDRYGTIWFATDSGLSKLTYNKFLTYTYDKNNNRSLSSNIIYDIYEDKSGLIWCGSASGINMINTKNIFEYYSTDSVTGIYEDEYGMVWVGTLGDGLNSINMDNGNIVNYEENQEKGKGPSDNTIWDITGDYEDNIWIATGNGLNRFNKKTQEFTYYLHDANDDNSIISNLVKTVEMDSNGLLWIGTEEGLCTLDKENNFVSYVERFRQKGISDQHIKSIYEDNDGVIWIGLGNYGGLVKYNTVNDEIKVYTNNPKNIGSISSNSINCINSDSQGNLWIGTEYGLNKFDPRTEKFTKYLEEDGLKNSHIYSVLLDYEDNVWMSTNFGISKFDVKNEWFKNFNESDGLQGKEFNLYAYCKRKNGGLIFGGTNGINMVNPRRLEANMYVPEVVIHNIQVNGLTVAASNNIVKRYNENNISLEFFFPDFRSKEKVQYLYKLEGLDDNWHFTSDRKYVNYVNLSSGKYKFIIKARGVESKWSDPTYINIEIKNPPWASVWAYCIYMIIVITIVLIIINYFTSLDRLVIERTSELKAQLEKNKILYDKLIAAEKYKNNYFINLSHELRTPLNVILSTEQLIQNINKSERNIEKNKLEYYMSVLGRNSKRLLNLINNIIDTSKIDTGSYKINCEEIDIIYLVEEVALSMKDFIEENGLELVIDPEVEEMMIYCDSVDIERCIVNLIGNAVKFTEKGGTIFVKVEDQNEDVYIIVEDTGIGIEEKYRESIFDRFSQSYEAITEAHGGSGLGLTLTRQLVELHEGEIWVESQVGFGSKFIISLPKRINNIVKCK